ncbi:hypothetical protein MLD38_022821 [Melastoma candidum]|uniref:Uncharacterized protein n=1 Tax=Melastoma candidum TaxID=119954 RepID=A0ACB9QLR1_9MYRT|nr:hypothetical protein MLD38_022821 [Melastoma candidum]
MTSLLPQGPAWWVRRQEKPSLGGQPNLGLKGEGFAGSERVSSPGQPIAAGEDRNPSWLLVEPELGRGSREAGCPLRHRRGRAVEVRGCHGGLRKENESGRVAVEKERREAGSLARLELYRVCRGGVAIAGSEDAGRKAHCGRKRGAAVGRDGARRRWGAAGESDLTTPGSGLAVIRSQNVCEAVGSASGSGAAGCAGEQVAAVRKCQRGGVAGAAVKLLEGWKSCGGWGGGIVGVEVATAGPGRVGARSEEEAVCWESAGEGAHYRGKERRGKPGNVGKQLWPLQRAA